MKTHPAAPISRDFPFAPVVAFFLSISLFVSGCTTMQSVPLPGSGATAGPIAPALAVHVGDQVRVRTTSGQILEFKVTALEPGALVGGNLRVTHDQIAGLEIKRTDKRATALTVVVVVIAVLLVGAGAAVAQSGIGLTGG